MREGYAKAAGLHIDLLSMRMRKQKEKKQRKDEAQRNLEFPFLGHHPTFGQLKVLTFRIYSFRRLVVKLNGFA